MRKVWLALLLMCNVAPSIADDNQTTQDNQLFLIDSGYFNGVYYQTAAMMSMLISQPSGSLPCQEGGACGIENVVLVNRSSNGSSENLQRLCHGESDSALVQSNLVYMAYQGEGIYEGKAPCKNLRALASLYPEVLQIAVPKVSGIKQLSDLQGKKVGIGATSSGTYHAVQELFNAAGVNVAEVQFQQQSVREAVLALKEKKLDGIIFFAGIPTPAFAALNEEIPLHFLSLQGEGINSFLKRSRSYQRVEVPASAYENSERFESVKVRALWVSTEKMNKDWAYRFTKTLWDSEHYPNWMKAIPLLHDFHVETSLEGISIPLHDGAKRYYNEIGKRF